MYRLFVLAVLLNPVLALASDDWPQWRGPARDGLSSETGLLQQWPVGGPKLVWKADELGTGYSSPSIAGGRVYLQTTNDDEEFAVALDEKSGKKIWSSKIGNVGPNQGPQYPGSRSTPTVDGDSVYCLSSDGDLACLENTTGKVVWSVQFREAFDGRVGSWAYSESVLVDGDMLICTPGGAAANLTALNKTTGDLIWQSSGVDAGGAEYASIMAVGEGPQKQYVQFMQNGVIGVDAKSGKFLWRYDRTAGQANILTPVVSQGRLFTAGSRLGGALVQLARDSDGAQANEVYFTPSLQPSIGGAVLVDGNLYGTSTGGLFCAEFDTGDIKWQERSIAAASVACADGRLYVRDHRSGDVILVEASASGYNELGRFTQPDRSRVQAWPHPVIANGRLYLRDQDVLLCYDVSAH